MAVTCNLTVKETNVDEANNKSTISVKLTATTSGQSYNNYTSGTNYPKGTITVNGTSYTIGSKLPHSTTVTLYNKTHTISHNSDGTKSVTIKYSFNTHISAGTLTGSKTLKLTDISIDKKSVPTVSSSTVAIDDTITINMNPYMSSYTHSISYKFNGGSTNMTSGLSATSGIKNSCTFTPPVSLINSMDANATSAKAVFTVNTYKSGTLLGSSTFSVTIIATASKYPPVMLPITASVYSNGSPFTDVYVKNYNGVTLSFNATAQQNAGIVSYRITGGGINATTTSNTYTIKKISLSGNVTYAVTATDSRGATCSSTITIKVNTYSPPAITSVNTVRCDKDGNPSDEGTYIKTEALASYSNIGNNITGSIIIKVQYAAEGGDYNSGNNLDIVKNSGTITANKIIGGSLGDGAYKVLYTITDAYNKTNTYSDVLSTSFYVLDINSGGTSIGIGAAASDADHVLTIGMDQLIFPNGENLSLNMSGIDFSSDTFQITSKATTLTNSSLTLSTSNALSLTSKSAELIADTLDLNSTTVTSTVTSLTLSKALTVDSRKLTINPTSFTMMNSGITTINSTGDIQLNSDYIRIQDNAILAAAGWANSGDAASISFNMARVNCKNGVDVPNNIAYRCKDSNDVLKPCMYVSEADYCFLGHNDLTGTVLRGKTVKLSNASGTTVTSDERVKKDFKSLDEYESFFMTLNPIAYKYLTGDSGRYHIGFKAQEVKKSLEDNKLTTQDFGGYVETEPDLDFYIDRLGYDPFNGDKMCGLSYEEFIGLSVHMIQKQYNKIKELENRIALLERGDI